MTLRKIPLGAALLTFAASAAFAGRAHAGLASAPTPQRDAEAVSRGARVYAVCAACHGANGHGALPGAADLTKSPIAMAADGGKKLGQFLKVGRPAKGMPAFPQLEGNAADLSAKIRSLAAPAAGS